MRHYFLGMASGYKNGVFRHLFTIGKKSDHEDLVKLLEKKYSGQAMLCKNGRSALALALKAYFDKGDAILVNGFTCYAVYEAIKSAGLVPVFVDISREDLNFSEKSVIDASFGRFESIRDNGSDRRSEPRDDGREQGGSRSDWNRVRGVIVQNTLGNPVDLVKIEKLAKKYGLTIIEDLAHSAGVRYPDGREAGTVGAATVLSFGKDKAIDTISGGALILRSPCKHEIKAPFKSPKLSDHLRDRMYPLFGVICRGLTYVKLGGAMMRMLVKIHWVERSADNRLDLERLPSKFESKFALEQIRDLKRTGEPPLREFYFVRDREELLAKLQKKGYFFGGFWYEKPVSPSRYYKKVHFPEADCPNAVYVADHIINLPTHYAKRDLAEAHKLVKEYLDDDTNEKGKKGEEKNG